MMSDTKAKQNHSSICLSDDHVTSDDSFNSNDSDNNQDSLQESGFSSPCWWTDDKHSEFNMAFICGRVESFNRGLTGACKVYMPDSIAVVKFYEKYKDVEDPDLVAACRHIDNEIRIYTHLNESSTEWPSHVPPLHFAGAFLSFNGSIISFVKGRSIKFSKMTQTQRDACEAALGQLHQFKVLHRDIHYGNLHYGN
jgi:hypothetical protein